MTNHSEQTFDPIKLATAKAAIESFTDYNSSADLLKISTGCSFAIKAINASPIIDVLDTDELEALMFSLLAVKDIAVAKAVATVVEEGRV